MVQKSRAEHSGGLTRRAAMQGIAAGVIANGFAGKANAAVSEVPSLGEIAAKNKLIFGTAFDIPVLDDPALRDLTRHHARILTTDVSLKFGAVRPEEDRTNFGPGDRLVNFANDASIPIRGHNLIWNEWNPPWVAKLSKERCAYWLDRHIDETMGRYEGRMHSWDVVNEPFYSGHNKPGGFRDGPWYEAMGKDYIRRAFVRASRADPKAKLVLNEAGAEWAWAFCDTDVDRTGVLQLIDEIRDAGARIDIIGLECHWLAPLKWDPNLLADFLGKLNEKKIDVYVTEMDVDDSPFPDDIGQRDRMVADRYAELLKVALGSPATKAVITWEIADTANWLYTGYKPKPNSSRRPRPMPFDGQMRPKAAYHAIAHALQRKLG